MNTSQRTQDLNSTARKAPSKLAEGFKNYTIAGISLPEVALLGAAGVVVWRNREKIRDFLETRGIDVPAVFTKDLSEIIQSGVNMASGGAAEETSASSNRGSKKRKDFHDA